MVNEGEQKLNVSTVLAVERTAMAASRNLMAWVRTGLSMIGFGFTIYKFLQSVSEGVRQNTPRDVGLFLIALGSASVLFGCFDYWKSVSELHQAYGCTFKKYPMAVGLLIGALGILLFFKIFLRIG